MGFFDKIFGIQTEEEKARILLSRPSNLYSRGDNDIFCEISDEILICEIFCHTEMGYVPRQFEKLTPDLLMLVGDFAGSTNVRNDAGRFAYDIIYDRNEEKYIFDKEVIIDAVKQFRDIEALMRVRARANSKCYPNPRINDDEIYAQIASAANQRIGQLTDK